MYQYLIAVEIYVEYPFFVSLGITKKNWRDATGEEKNIKKFGGTPPTFGASAILVPIAPVQVLVCSTCGTNTNPLINQRILSALVRCLA
jgi:hypothetical protein